MGEAASWGSLLKSHHFCVVCLAQMIQWELVFPARVSGCTLPSSVAPHSSAGSRVLAWASLKLPDGCRRPPISASGSSTSLLEALSVIGWSTVA